MSTSVCWISQWSQCNEGGAPLAGRPRCQRNSCIILSFTIQPGCGIVDCTSESSEIDAKVDKRGQHSRRMFFQRILFDYSNVSVERDVIEDEINDLCVRFGMESQLSWGGDKRRRIAIFVSKYDHCLWELLLRQRAGELDCEIAMAISNHEKLRHVADTFDIPYHVFPITKDNKLEQEEKQISLIEQHNVDLLVLARYMQILSPSFCSRFQNQIINIHHSFLPAFRGGSPYHKAHERGVKLVGATAHYATTELDEGPIIEQDIMRVSHRDDVKDLVRKGRTLEKTCLTNAVKAHLDDRIITHRSKCIVFAE
mmetsp:Transcript_26517/g.53225  ORF Transcript_26517/g.53225 Transcript_26517/m.53225 type:complete len:311 (+) Transcript_26517:113-1045(+)